MRKCSPCCRRSRLVASSESFRFFSSDVIVGSRLIVIATEVSELLFSYRLAIQSRLIVGDFAL